jgi:4-amino-4-deoxy-L-arabinose transferase-like glycosyltransferase
MPGAAADRTCRRIPGMATTVLPPVVPSSATRRAPWRSPAGQPGYARPALLLISAFAVLLYAWGINRSQYHTFYADSVRSMTESWKGFFFGSFDPGNSITLDKLPGFLWPQAAAARVFGFHPWVLTLPQVVEGVAGVLVLFRVVRRWAGVDAGLIACAAFLLTPVTAGLFRTAVEDPAFTLCVLLAADATARAAEAGRVRPLLLAGVFVGLGFQAKMLEAWAVLPALAAAYLLAAPVARRRRFAHVALAGLVTFAVSASWVLAVGLIPPKDRPYVDGTTDNSAFSMVVGYNFMNRFSALGITAAATGSVSATQGTGHHGGLPAGGDPVRGHGAEAGAPGHSAGVESAPGGGSGGSRARNGWSKMFGMPLASQTGWLYPLGAIALACGVLWRRRAPRTDRLRAGFVLWGVWLVTYFLVFSAGNVGGHIYYMGVVSTPLAALAGGGIAVMWREYRAGGRRTWALPVAVTATVAWGAYVCLRFTSFVPWLAPVTLTAGLAGAALLVAARPAGPLTARRRVAVAGALTGLAAMLLAPAAWTAQVFNPAWSRTGMMGSVGPTDPNPSPYPTAGRGGFGHSSSGRLNPAQRRLLDYVNARRGTAEYVLATTNWTGASPFILAAGAHVLPLGGFSGRVPFPTDAGFRRLTASGRVRYVAITPARRPARAGTPASPADAARITSWVRSSCPEVPGVPTLYDCGDQAKR